ncbi:MAG: hypothetical protein HUJ68_01150, partial [Clostridia bacterium]|nr:hypothetical protein [Clostridia bacterium]
MRYYQQFDESDCGAACLAMIAYYKKVQTASVQMDKYPYEYTSPL